MTEHEKTGTYMSTWLTVYEGHPQPKPRRIDRHAYWQRRRRVKWWIHNRLFPDCYGEDYT